MKKIRDFYDDKLSVNETHVTSTIQNLLIQRLIDLKMGDEEKSYIIQNVIRRPKEGLDFVSDEEVLKRIKILFEAEDWGLDYEEFYSELIKTLEKITPKIRELRETGKTTDEESLKQSFSPKGAVLKFHEKQPFFYDRGLLFWMWNQTQFKYQMIDETDVILLIEKNLGLWGTLTKSSVKTEYLEAFRQVGRAKIPKPLKKTMIQLKDKIYDLETDEVFESTPEMFAVNPIPYSVGDSEDTPYIDKLFTEWVGEEKKIVLYEIIAYCMLPDYPLHRIFCFVGSGCNGKGEFFRLLTEFINKSNTCSSELDYIIDNRFEVCKLYKKIVCFLSETNFAQMKKTSLLKRLSGGDLIGFEFKNKTPFDDYNTAKLLIATNGLPTTTDKTRGFYRRWMIIDFPNQFSEKKQVLKEIPDIEFKNLARKCLRIAKELIIKREFSFEGSIEERQKRYEEKSNPLAHFIKEKCSLDPNTETPLFEFYEAFSIFCKERGQRVFTKNEVTKNLREEGYEIKLLHRKSGEIDSNGYEIGKTWNFILGLNFEKFDNKNQEINGINQINHFSVSSHGGKQSENTLIPLISLISEENQAQKPINSPILIEKKQVSTNERKKYFNICYKCRTKKDVYLSRNEIYPICLTCEELEEKTKNLNSS
jgi:P4 family phage/plasmid primase-like protien